MRQERFSKHSILVPRNMVIKAQVLAARKLARLHSISISEDDIENPQDASFDVEEVGKFH